MSPLSLDKSESTGVGNRGKRGVLAPSKKFGKIFWGKYHVKFENFVNLFSGKYHVKFRHFVNFSYIYFRAKISFPQS